MKIITLPKVKKKKDPFKVKAKCVCGCKVLLDDPIDVSYVTGYTGISDIPYITYGYVCPSCETFQELSEHASNKITRAISKNNGINIRSYMNTCSDICIDYHVYGTMMHDYDMDIYTMMELGLPLPKRVKDDLMKRYKEK